MRKSFGVAAALGTAVAVLASSPYAQATGTRVGAPAPAGLVAADPGPSGPSPVGLGPGHASRPSRPATTTPPSSQDVVGPIPDVTGYRTSGAPLHVLPTGSRPYDDWPVIPSGGNGLVDDQGVRMFKVPGDPRIWDHPVAQAQYALLNLNSYRLTGNRVYLDRAAANAARLVEKQTMSEGAAFYPYPFDWHFYGDTVCTAPWYSAMAQGQALSAFVRLYQATQDPQWKAAADRTFESLAQAPATDRPFASWVDDTGRLWLEEYPQTDVVHSEKVLNGHIFAIFGLADYWSMTDANKARAKALYDGAVTTVQDTMLSVFRNPGWASFYSMRHQQVNPSYHKVHVAELLMLFQLTHRAAFARVANTFRADYPKTEVSGKARLTRKVRRVFQVRRGIVTKVKRVRLARKVVVTVDGRQRTHDRGIMLHLTSGRYATWYVRERYGTAWMTQPTDEHTYRPRAVNVVFAPGTYVGYRYSSTGRRLETRRLRFTRRSAAPSARSAIVGGESALEFTSGSWAGFWVPVQAGMIFS
jgi:hypothetical protein